jgi:hypothetical protein
MAVALNVFKTLSVTLASGATQNVYTPTTGYNGIVLMAQLANVTASTATATVSHYSPADSTETELIKNFAIPANDAASATTGKLVIQENHILRASASASSTIKLTLSILESYNG